MDGGIRMGKLIRQLGYSQLIIIPIEILILSLTDNYGLLLFLNGIILLLMEGSIGILFFSEYLKETATIEKKKLRLEHKKLSKNINKNKRDLNARRKQSENISKTEKTRLANQEHVHLKKLRGFDNRRTQIDNKRRAEIASELRRLQKLHFSSGLRNTLIAKSKISGIGGKLAEKLRNYGVESAGDVTANNNAGIPGFG